MSASVAQEDTTPTPAQELRDAAKRLREFAKGTTPADGGWLGHADEETGHAFIFGGPIKDGYRTGTVFEFRDEMDCENCIRPSAEDLCWMWLMSPELAEPLATWLEAVAGGWEKSAEISPGGSGKRFAAHPALAVARVILGRSS